MDAQKLLYSLETLRARKSAKTLQAGFDQHHFHLHNMLKPIAGKLGMYDD